jgi:hypothetical protein
MTEPRPLPWTYEYLHEAPRQREVLRPIVSVSIVESQASTPTKALVDSGSEHVLAAPWLAQDIGLDLSRPKHEIEIGIGGGTRTAFFFDLRLRLLHPDGTNDEEYLEWETEVGFLDSWKPPWPVLLDQTGFFDTFTISMHRSARRVAVEEWTVFDKRFGIDGVREGEIPQGAPRRY